MIIINKLIKNNKTLRNKKLENLIKVLIFKFSGRLILIKNVFWIRFYKYYLEKNK